MCIVISIVMLVLGYNLYMAGNVLAAVGSVATSLVFIGLMVKNIQRVKKLKKEKEMQNQ